MLCEDCFPEDFAALFDKAVLPSVRDASSLEVEDMEQDQDDHKAAQRVRCKGWRWWSTKRLETGWQVRLGVSPPWQDR